MGIKSGSMLQLEWSGAAVETCRSAVAEMGESKNGFG